jgi:hypothetical protein
MSDSYKVNINDSFKFDLDKEQVSQLDAQIWTPILSIFYESKSFRQNSFYWFSSKKYVVKVNNNSYTVEIANDLDLLIKELGFEVTKTD